MNDLRYIEKEKTFLQHSFDVFKKYFNNDRGSFNSFYNSIDSKNKKNKFLKIASFYKFLIVNGKFTVESDKSDTYMDYLDHTYKYIAIFSFIEDLYTDEEHKDFYSWLKSIKTKIINSESELDILYKRYLSIHGSTQKAVRFFESLDNKTKENIANCFRVKGYDKKDFTYLAKLLYQIRNDFVHGAKLITQFNTGTTIHTTGNKLIVNNLDIESMMAIFEKGFLKLFGFTSAKMI